jgi:hypothetical protein
VTRLLVRIAPVVIVLQLVALLAGTGSAAAQDELSDQVAYVVRASSAAESAAAARAAGVQPTVTFDRAVDGFAARMTRAQVDLLRARPGVLGVE